MEVADEKLKSAVKLPVDLMGDQATNFLNVIRGSMRLGSVINLELDGFEFKDHQTYVYLNFLEEVKIEDEELGEASGIYVTHPGHATLIFDEKGQLKEYELVRPTENEETSASLKASVMDLLARNAVYFAKPGELVELDKLPRNQNFMVVTDATGKRKLERARSG